MPKRLPNAVIPKLGALNRSGGQVGMQLAQLLRTAIAAGDMKPGERLPSTRTMALSLGLARATVVNVFEQLKAEGYLDSKVGAGTRVVEVWGMDMAPPPTHRSPPAIDIRLPVSVPRLSKVLKTLTSTLPHPFSIAVPAAGIEPDDNWRRLGNRVRASKLARPTGYADPFGAAELRVAIAGHVRRARAVDCDPAQVIVTSGTQQALYIACRVLLERGDAAIAEDPTYPGLTAILDDLEIRTHRVRVDAKGIDVELAASMRPKARVVFVTPSHQYPLGMPLSMGRRKSLISWAQLNQGWIVEDDYDSELRYAGHPFPSMQGLDPSRVVYLGTFSKVLYPSLRIGYVIAPAPLVEAFAGARAILDRHSPNADQQVLAAYMHGGFFESHIRRIRGLYAERRSFLLSAIAEVLSNDYQVEPSDQGMHIVLWLPDEMSDVRVAAEAHEAGLSVKPISAMYAVRPRQGLMLGFGGFPSEKMRPAVDMLARILEASRKEPCARP